MPRQTKALNRAVVDRIIQAIEKGCTLRAAASAGPISESTLHSWLRQADIDQITGVDSPHAEFRRRVDVANAAAERAITELFRAQCPTDWRACVAFLERRFPKDWGRRVELSSTSYPDALTDDERADAIADAMEHYLRIHDVDVPPELSTQIPAYPGSSNGHL